MAVLEHELQVVVPVGFLLAEPQEVTVSVDRPGGVPLPLRLRLVPARPLAAAPEPVAACAPTPLALAWSSRTADFDDSYTEYGGGD